MKLFRFFSRHRELKKFLQSTQWWKMIDESHLSRFLAVASFAFFSISTMRSKFIATNSSFTTPTDTTHVFTSVASSIESPRRHLWRCAIFDCEFSRRLAFDVRLAVNGKWCTGRFYDSFVVLCERDKFNAFFRMLVVVRMRCHLNASSIVFDDDWKMRKTFMKI